MPDSRIGGWQSGGAARAARACVLAGAGQQVRNNAPSSDRHFFQNRPDNLPDRLGDKRTVNSNKEVVRFAHHDMQLHRGNLDPYKTILNMQGLPRDLSLSSETELLQQFVPELKRLRLGPPITIHSAAAAATTAAAEPLAHQALFLPGAAAAAAGRLISGAGGSAG